LDEVQFDEYHRATVRRLVQYAYAICGDLGTAQDLAHEAYLRAWQRWRQLGGYDDLEAWLRLVVTRLCTDRCAAWRSTGGPCGSCGRPGPPPSDDTVVLVAALRELPPKQREAIVLHYLRGLAVHAIATEMGATAGTVRSWLARGRAALSMNLNEPTRSATEEGHR
jgi:RNA polymerase sigma-70 factor (ECF subfamily)